MLHIVSCSVVIEALAVKTMPFVEFMDRFPDEKDGLWGVVQEISGKSIDIPIF